MSNKSKETEAVLIVKQDMEKIPDAIAGLRSIAGYILKPKATHNIHDTYFDSKDQILRRKRTSLRIREIDGAFIISVKSNPKTIRSGLITRSETELPWSSEALRRVTNMLSLPVNQARAPDSRTDPIDTMSRIGLQIIQDRQTTRQSRDVVATSSSEGAVLAELVIDRVTYRFQDHTISIFEIEVEAKTKDSSVIREVTLDLLHTYQPKLQKWKYGKFVTGDAIGKLVQSGELKECLDGNQLTLLGFNLIERFIRSNLP